jgi:hypothetical protein
MKYQHKHTKTIVDWDDSENQYTNSNVEVLGYLQNTVYLDREMVEDSDDWKLYNELTEEIKNLQNIPCLSINDVARVYVTANRYNSGNQSGLEKQGRELLEIVREKVSEQIEELKQMVQENEKLINN